MMRYRPLGSPALDPRLGRYVPDDDRHIQLFPFATVAPQTVSVVNKTLRLPKWHWDHDQGWRQGSCVGHGTAMERAIVNSQQNKVLKLVLPGRRYDPIDIWNWAKAHDQWAETNPGDDDGTSVRAAYDGMRLVGPRRIKTAGLHMGSDGQMVVTDQRRKADLAEGVEVTRWARTVNEMRTAVSQGKAITIGVNWYSAADKPVKYNGEEWWIAPSGAPLGSLLGGHCTVIYGASDRRQAFRMKNSWGRSYPLVWLPYTVMERLLDANGEAAVITDR